MLLRTSRTGPPPAGGSEPVIAMSCSSTSQRSYPDCSRRPRTASIPASPSPSGRNRPACVAFTSERVPSRTSAARRASTSLRWTWPIRARVLAHERGGVDAADQQVTGVQAPRHVGVGERPVDLRRRLDERADVRVEHEVEALGRDEVGERAQVLAGALPPGLVEVRRRRPGGIRDERRDEDVAAGRGELGGRAGRIGARGGEVGVVDHDRHEPADEPQLVAVELGAGLRAVERQPALRTQLGRRDPQVRHLGQHTIGRQLPPPARDLAHAPRDRRGREPRRQPRCIDTAFHVPPSPPERAPDLGALQPATTLSRRGPPCQEKFERSNADI